MFKYKVITPLGLVTKDERKTRHEATYLPAPCWMTVTAATVITVSGVTMESVHLTTPGLGVRT